MAGGEEPCPGVPASSALSFRGPRVEWRPAEVLRDVSSSVEQRLVAAQRGILPAVCGSERPGGVFDNFSNL